MLVVWSDRDGRNRHEVWRYHVPSRTLTCEASVRLPYHLVNAGRLVQLPSSGALRVVNNPALGSIRLWSGHTAGDGRGVTSTVLDATDPRKHGSSYGGYLFVPNPIYGSTLPAGDSFWCAYDMADVERVCRLALFRVHTAPDGLVK